MLSLFLSGEAAIPPPCSILVRRSAVAGIGGFEERFRGLYEDQVFYAKLCLEHAVFISDECLDAYRQHPESICSSTADSRRELVARQEYLEWLRGYVSQRGVADDKLRLALRQAVWLARAPGWGLLPHRLYLRVRWARKWRARLEGLVLPRSVQRRLWARRVPDIDS